MKIQFLSGKAAVPVRMPGDDRLKFEPPYFFSEWMDRDSGIAKRLTIVLLLPSGISGADVEADIVQDGLVYEMNFIWAQPFMKPERPCAAFIADPEDPKYKENHPEVIAMEKELKNIRTAFGLTQSKPIPSKTQISLPFEVEEGRKEKYACNHLDTQNDRHCNVLHIRLYTKETEYDVKIPLARS